MIRRPGSPPAFFEGNPRAFADLRFHVGDGTFAFYRPLRMGEDPLWIDVSELLRQGAADAVQRYMAEPAHRDRIGEFLNRLNPYVEREVLALDAA